MCYRANSLICIVVQSSYVSQETVAGLICPLKLSCFCPEPDAVESNHRLSTVGMVDVVKIRPNIGFFYVQMILYILIFSGIFLLFIVPQGDQIVALGTTL